MQIRGDIDCIWNGTLDIYLATSLSRAAYLINRQNNDELIRGRVFESSVLGVPHFSSGLNFQKTILCLLSSTPYAISLVEEFCITLTLQFSAKIFLRTFICMGAQSNIWTFFILVHGDWSAWSEWGDCSQSCGGGVQGRRRSCTNPPPSNGGRDCAEKSTEVRTCNLQGCPGDLISSTWLMYQQNHK